MSLKEQLMEDMKNAMRARDSVKLGAIRFLQAEIRNTEIDHGEQNDDGVQKIIARQIKQMRDAINDYQKADRSDLVEAEEAKVKVLEAYLPQQLSDAELEAIVTSVISENAGANMGQLIGQVMKQAEGKADGGRVSAMVKAQLGS
jgi:uncharacterized protein YqeY